MTRTREQNRAILARHGLIECIPDMTEPDDDGFVAEPEPELVEVIEPLGREDMPQLAPVLAAAVRAVVAAFHQPVPRFRCRASRAPHRVLARRVLWAGLGAFAALDFAGVVFVLPRLAV